MGLIWNLVWLPVTGEFPFFLSPILQGRNCPQWRDAQCPSSEHGIVWNILRQWDTVMLWWSSRSTVVMWLFLHNWISLLNIDPSYRNFGYPLYMIILTFVFVCLGRCTRGYLLPGVINQHMVFVFGNPPTWLMFNRLDNEYRMSKVFVG